MGPGAITPDKDIKTASNKKADSNNFYSLAEKNFFKKIMIFLLYSIYSFIALIFYNRYNAKKVKEIKDKNIEIINII